jgi:hypothetical protein
VNLLIPYNTLFNEAPYCLNISGTHTERLIDHKNIPYIICRMQKCKYLLYTHFLAQWTSPDKIKLFGEMQLSYNLIQTEIPPNF